MTSETYKPKVLWKNFIVAPQNMAPANLISIEQQLEKCSISPAQDVYDPHCLYCYSSTVTSDVPD